jgi:hypothetical protein
LSAVDKLTAVLRTRSSQPGFRAPSTPRPGSPYPSIPGHVDPATMPRFSQVEPLLRYGTAEPVLGLSSERAKDAWENGRHMLRSQDPRAAFEEFQVARDLDPGNRVYRLYFLATLWQLSDDSPDRIELQRELKPLANAHTCIEGHIGYGFYVLGLIALQEGDQRTARRRFKESLEHDPENRDAAYRYRALMNQR